MDEWIELARALTSTGDLLVLRERTGCVELRCNGWELMSNRAHHSEEALAAFACEQLVRAERKNTPPPLEGEGWGEGLVGANLRSTPPPNPLPQGEGEYVAPDRPDPRAAATAPHVLIGGLGLGYTLRAALERLPQSARVTVAELLPEIIAWNRGPFAPFAGHPLTDPRVLLICSDVAALLCSAEPASFDAILLDTDNGPDSVMLQANASLYAPRTLRTIRRALRPAGVLAVWSADPSPRFEQNLRDAGFQWRSHDVHARGAPDDPLHTIYLAWKAA
jgi:SAM-dependent methyltransferase